MDSEHSPSLCGVGNKCCSHVVDAVQVCDGVADEFGHGYGATVVRSDPRFLSFARYGTLGLFPYASVFICACQIQCPYETSSNHSSGRSGDFPVEWVQTKIYGDAGHLEHLGTQSV